jgi:death-on-curing protein
MITLEIVLGVHRVLIKKYGGAAGVRDIGALESAIRRPYQEFEGKQLYATTPEKAAAVIESIVYNHPFIDGNKRTGYVMMRLVLMEDGKDIQASTPEKYDFVIQIASGKIAFNEIRSWIEERLVS